MTDNPFSAIGPDSKAPATAQDQGQQAAPDGSNPFAGIKADRHERSGPTPYQVGEAAQYRKYYDEKAKRSGVSGKLADLNEWLGGGPEATFDPEYRQFKSGPVAALTSFGNYRSGGFGDELRAAFVSAVTPRKYDETLDLIREKDKQNEENAPIGSLVGSALGVASDIYALKGLPTPTTVAGQVGSGIAGGAAYGAVTGFGEGDGGFQNRLDNAIDEAKSGAVWGGAIPLGLGAAGLGAKGVGAGMRAVRDTKNFYLNPAQFAEDQFVRSAVKDRVNFNKEAARANAAGRGAEPARFMNEPEMLAAEGAGQRVNVGDLGGDNARAAVKTATVVSPDAADEILGASRARQMGMGERAAQTVTDMFDGPGVNPVDVLDDLKAKARTENKANYDAAYSHPAAANVWSDAIRNITRPAVVQEAMAKAAKEVVEDGNVRGLRVGEPLFRAGADGKLDYSVDWGGASLHYWDYVGRALNDAVEKAKGPNGKWTHEAERISNYRKQLLSAVEDATRLDDGTSLFKKARSTAKDFFDAEDAHEAGMKYFTNQNAMNTARVRQELQGMTPSERELFARGYAASYLHKLSTLGDERDVNRLLGNANARMKLVDSLGQERAAKVEAHAIRSGIQRLMGETIQRGSDTARNQYMMKELAGQLGVGMGAAGVESYLSGGVSGQTLLTGALFGALRRKMKGLGQGKMEQYAKAMSALVTSEDPDTIARVYTRIQSDPKLAEITRQFAAQGLAAGGRGFGMQQSGPAGQGAQRIEPRFKGGGVVEAVASVAKKAMKSPNPKLEGEALIEDWKWRPEKDVADELGLQDQPVPDAPKNFGYFMKEMSDKAGTTGLTKRDLVKAFAITRASIQRRAQKADKLREGGFDIPGAGDTVRPEGAMAEWFFTPHGQRYLDNAEKGVIDEEAIADFQNKFRPFGKADQDVPDFMRGAVTMFDDDYVKQLSDLVARGARGESTPEEWRAATERLRGIGPAKKGFIASLLGRGDQPTPDARQLVLQTGRPSKEASTYMSRRGGRGGDAAVQRLTDRQRRLNMKLPAELDPYYQHLVHHTIWDKVAGEKTTHADIIRAMRLAAMAGVIPAGVASQYISALEDEKNGVQTFSKGGLAQLSEAVGGVPFSGGSPGGVAKAALKYVSRALGTSDISETTLADIARMHNITPEQLATGYSALEHGAKSKKTGAARAVIGDWKFKSSRSGQPLLERKAFDLNEMKVGDVVIPAHGDRTSLGVNIHEVDDVPLVSPTTTSGGFDFPLSDHQQQEGAMWRSDAGIISGLNNKAEYAAEASRRLHKGKVDPAVWMATINMGKRSGDYSGQPLDVALNMIPNMKIDRSAKAEYDGQVQGFIDKKNAGREAVYKKSMIKYEKDMQAYEKRMEKWEKSGKRGLRPIAPEQPSPNPLPQWPGLDNRLDALHMIQQPTPGIGEVRKFATQLMDAPDFFDANFPNMGSVRLATTKPELAAMDDYAHVGYMMGKRRGSGLEAIDNNPLLYHPSYSTNWLGDQAGGLMAALKDEEFFKRWKRFVEKRRMSSGKKSSPQAFYRSMANTRAYQIVDQELLDMLHAAEEAAKKSR